MLPSELNPAAFRSYPPQARQLAVERLALLQQLPLSLLPLLLRELIAYDWKFPAERKEVDRQLNYLASLTPDQRRQVMATFDQLRLSPELERVDWVSIPGLFSEQLTAHLWATHQIDGFHTAAVEYMKKVDVAAPPEAQALPRLGIVIVGQGVAENSHPLFRKLRPQGVYFKRVKADNGFRILADAAAERSAMHPIPFGHWYIEGASRREVSLGLTCVSYHALEPVRAALLNKMKKGFESSAGSEAIRTMLAQIRPEDVGLSAAGDDAILNHFQVSLLTEGSGTQIYSTTFVQWAARETLRRAQPVTLLVRFAPRRREQSMSEILAGIEPKPATDPQGSLIDADMGAYYTWINQQRLAGAEKSSFLAWFEDHNEAVAIGPALSRGTESNTAVDLRDILNRMA